MKLAASIAVFAILMGVRDSVEGVVPRIIIAGAAGIALAFALAHKPSHSAAESKPKNPGSSTPGSFAGPRTLVVLVGLIYVTAWFLPVIEGGETLRKVWLPGWEAMTTALRPLFEPSDFGENPVQGALCVLSSLSNILFLTALIRLLYSGRPSTNRWTWALAGAAAVNTHWLFWGGLLSGYYLWLASFVLLALIARARTTREIALAPGAAVGTA